MTQQAASGRIARAWSATTLGIDAIPVEVEVHVRSGLPSWTVVGLPQITVRESRDRVFSAIRASGLPVPRGAITVSMAPADVPKHGALFDLAVATALLAADGVIPPNGRASEIPVLGELSLDGRVRPVPGVLAVALSARERGAREIVVPMQNAPEAAAAGGLDVYGVARLDDAVDVLRGRGRPWSEGVSHRDCVADDPDMSDVVGQAGARRAMEIAAAGRHNVLLVGPPGVGKSMLARRLPGILPRLTTEESLESTRVHSVAGLHAPGAGLMNRPPFRAPHHSVTLPGLLGGGSPPSPGEISLAHRGVLFLDELPEFRHRVREALRQPLEDGTVVISRARWRIRMPCDVLLVASMNACPCGRAPTPACTCGPGAVSRYLRRVSGPLVDRIDLHVHVDPVLPGDWTRPGGERSEAVRSRVESSRRFGMGRGSRTGGPEDRLAPACELLLARAIGRLGLSARATVRIRDVARTIADLAQSEPVLEEHVAEAVQYRGLDRELR